MSPEDFPRGFAETSDHDIHKRLLCDVRDGRVLDFGLRDYGECLASLSDAARLLDEGMTLNGVEGTVSVVYRYANGIQLRWRPTDPHATQAPRRVFEEIA